MKRFLLACLAIALPLAVSANGGHKPKEDPKPIVITQKESSSKHFWRGVGVASLAGLGLYYVLSDHDECSGKDDAKVQPPAAIPPAPAPAETPKSESPKPAPKPAILKPKAKPRECEIPGAKPKPVTRVGIGTMNQGAVGFVIGHDF